MQAADAQRRGAGPSGLLRGPALRGRHGLAGHPAYDVVCLGREVPAVGEPLRGAHLGHRREQRRGDDGGVHVDATEVDHAAVGRPVELLPGRWPVLGPGGLVPPVAQHDPAALRPAERLDALQALGEVGTADQVQARQRDAGRGRVDVGVDERRA